MLSGDLDKLGRIAARVSSLRDVPAVAAPLVSERLEQLVQLEFDAGIDPYGEAWTELAPATIAKGRHAPPLTDTRELRDSLLVYPSKFGVRMTIGTQAHPAGPHQTGWEGKQGSGPARPIFPTGEMPDSWANAIQDAIVDSVIAKLGEVG
jgi:hypothetical protein